MRRLVAGTGRVLITVGILILLFVGYQLWGTGYFTARAQNELESELERFSELASTTTSAAPISATRPTNAPQSSTSTTRPRTTSTSTPETLPVITEGDAIGYIRIPKIGVDWVFVQGTSRDDLKEGPGHYPTTVLPGQIGNAAIAGHRTTYGAPFGRLDELGVGDEIIVEMPYLGTFVYEIFGRPDEQPNPFVVLPSQVEVADQEAALKDKIAMITLTTCHPKYSARERLVAQARLVIRKSAAPVSDKDDLPVKVAKVGGQGPSEIVGEDVGGAEADIEDPFAGDRSARQPAIAWAFATVLVGLLWWWFYRRFRHPALWFVGVVPFAVPLIGFYIYLERTLPAGY